MIFELEAQNFIQIIEDIYWLIPPKKVGFFLWIVSSLTVLLYSFYKAKRKQGFQSNVISLIMPSIIYIGVFINTYGIIDEVSINLEHSYNLYHFGKFSMSPDKMIDGTVEILYYLLHTPFAHSQSMLIFGNFLIALIIGWLHLFVLWRLKLTGSNDMNLILLSCFSLYFPIVSIFSSGFGNSLVSLLFLIALCFHLRNNPVYSLLVSGLLPLIRHDAILISMAILFSILLTDRRRNLISHLKRKWLVFLFVMPLLSLFSYCLFFKITYGHWLATPILFKSVKLSMFYMFEWKYFIAHLKEEMIYLSRSRNIDLELFISLYDSQKKVQYKCD